MYDLTAKKNRVVINIKALSLGKDLCVIISGGDKPHIGSISLGLPRPSLANPNINSATTSVLNLLGHKDGKVAEFVSNMLASKLIKNVVVICGIHIDHITDTEISTVIELSKELTNKLIKHLNEHINH